MLLSKKVFRVVLLVASFGPGPSLMTDATQSTA
jgi:hypothetical protein